MTQKWNLQDIVPPDKRKRPTAPTAQRRERVAPRGAPEVLAAEAPQEPEPSYQTAPDEVDAVIDHLDIVDGRLSKLRTYILSGVVVALVLFAGFATTILMSGAEVTIKPKAHATTVQSTITAKLKPAVGELGYELLTLEEVGERQVAATGKEEAKIPATGKITVYNAFSTTPQRLIKNTRFESPSGLIYRISDSIEIPGYKKDANGTVVPGSITALVLADSTGEAYNVTDIRFTIPGLKGTDQFEKMYAQTTAEGITGGFEGIKFNIDETELATVKQKLDTELRDKLLARIASERPNGFIAFDPSITFSYESLPSAEANEKTAIIKERVRLFIPLFKESDFSAFIAQSAVPGYDKNPVRIEDPSKLAFSYEPVIAGDIGSEESIRFKLSGSINIIWQVNEEKLKKELLGLAKNEVPKLFATYPSIDKAESVIHPIWKSSFPKDPDTITIHLTASPQ